MKVEPGDIVEISSPMLRQVLRTSQDSIIGEVDKVFDALTLKGEEGINLEIDIRYGRDRESWFRYKPAIDKGHITILRKHNE